MCARLEAASSCVDPPVHHPISTCTKEAIMDNKYVRGLVPVVVGFVILGALLWLGEAIAPSSSSEAYGLSAQGPFGAGGWVTSLSVGARARGVRGGRRQCSARRLIRMGRAPGVGHAQRADGSRAWPARAVPGRGTPRPDA